MKAIDKLIAQCRSMELAKKHHKLLKVQLQRERLKLSELIKQVEKEYDDLVKMEKLKLKHLFRKVLESEKEQYEIERQEYLHAFLQYKETLRIVELMEFEDKILTDKLKNAKLIKTNLKAVLLERSELIAEKYPSIKDKLDSVDAQLDQLIKYKREIYEAKIAAAKVSKNMAKMEQFVSQASEEQDWGSFYYQRQKSRAQINSKLDAAQRLSPKIKLQLRELEEELKDVYRFNKLSKHHQFEAFHHFTDIYYDRLIADWIVRKKIVHSLGCIRANMDSLSQIIYTLEKENKEINQKIKNLKSQRNYAINKLLS